MNVLSRSFSQKQKILLTGILGNVLEFYDYSLYGFFIPLFSSLFFTNKNMISSLFFSLSAFAAGYLSRPLGSMVFGYIGDRYGRQKSYTISIVLMAAATFSISILPTYSQLGTLASLLLIISRLLQGFSAGGEYLSSFVFTLEHIQENKKGFAGAILASSQLLGFTLGALTYILITQTNNPNWNWRYPFFLGALLGLIGFFIRRNLAETPEFQTIKTRNSIGPNLFIEAFKKSKRNIFALTGLTICLTGINSAVYIYSNIFFEKFNWPQKNIILYKFFSQGVCILVTLGAGYLSDKINKRLIMMISLMSGIMLTLPIYKVLLTYNVDGLLLFYIFIGLVIGGCAGPWCALVNECFPIAYKLTGIGLGFSIAQAITAGLTPLILETITLYIQNHSVLVYYLLTCFFIGFLSLVFMRPLEVSNLKIRKKIMKFLPA